jgi:hypothetical protein
MIKSRYDTVLKSRLVRKVGKYNLRSLKAVNYTRELIRDAKSIVKKQQVITLTTNNNVWSRFNEYQSVENCNENSQKDYISATSIKNYLLDDPLLDWLQNFHSKFGFNQQPSEQSSEPSSISNPIQSRLLTGESTQMSILFEMGHKFEDAVIAEIKARFPNKVATVVVTKADINPESMNRTKQFMNQSIPFIEQAALYNHKNRTFGIADLLVRSDWINKLVNQQVLTDDEITVNNEYYYLVIDIKWTTMTLCSDGKLIRNSDRFPAYKGQLAIYNAALGILQGYTPNKAFILTKAWSFTKGSNSFEGYNCFDRLGHIDYAGFDNKYVENSIKAIKWVRRVRFNGHLWSCIPPSVPNLYPNMNNRYDTPYHSIKKEIANKIDELTQIWMVSTHNREIAHAKGIYRWSDPRCTAKTIGINGKKIAPIVNQILDINRTDKHIILPQIVRNNTYEWQIKKPLDFYVDFETISGVFRNTDCINLCNSKQQDDFIFMIGVGYEQDGQWTHHSFVANSLSSGEERRILQQFVNLIESKVHDHMIEYNVENRQLSYPTIFHWGHAERSMFSSANRRHRGAWANWVSMVNWLDFCAVFRQEPIVIKNATKFNLKDIANTMYGHGLIKTKWDSNGPTTGLDAMIDAANCYKTGELSSMSSIGYYNEVDCKVVYEIVEYLRINQKN